MSKPVRRRKSRAVVQHGLPWDEGYRLEATSRGDLPVTVVNPGKGDVRLMPNGTLEISNHGRAAGEAISLVVEF